MNKYIGLLASFLSVTIQNSYAGTIKDSQPFNLDEASASITGLAPRPNGDFLISTSTKDGLETRLYIKAPSEPVLKPVCHSIKGYNVISSDGMAFLSINYKNYGKRDNAISVYSIENCRLLARKLNPLARTAYDANVALGIFVWSTDYRDSEKKDDTGSNVFITTFSGVNLKKIRGHRFYQDVLFSKDGTELRHTKSELDVFIYSTKNWRLKKTNTLTTSKTEIESFLLNKRAKTMGFNYQNRESLNHFLPASYTADLYLFSAYKNYFIVQGTRQPEGIRSAIIYEVE